MKKYTEKDLVDFGNQLLSKEREVLHEINMHQVTDADIENFKKGRECFRHLKEIYIPKEVYDNTDINSQVTDADLDAFKEGVIGTVDVPVITEENVLKLGFTKHSEYTYKMFSNKVYGYLNEIELFFEPNEKMSATVRQTTFNKKDLDLNSIFIRDMEYISEIEDLIKSF